MFASVFPRPAFAVPTPEATPEIGSLSALGQPFGVLTRSSQNIEESVQVSRAWSLAINWLKAVLDGKGNHLDRQHQQAFELLVSHHQHECLLRKWFLNAVTEVFDSVVSEYEALTESWHVETTLNFRPSITASLVEIEKHAARCMSISGTASNSGFSNLLQHWFHMLGGVVTADWTTMVSALPFCNRIQSSFEIALCKTLEVSSDLDEDTQCPLTGSCLCSISLASMPLGLLRSIGIGPSMGETAMAEALNVYIKCHLIWKKCFRVDWQGSTGRAARVRDWIDHQLAPMLEDALHVLASSTFVFKEGHKIALGNAAVRAIGEQRLVHQFNYIKTWPVSEGAIEDIKAFLAVEPSIAKKLICSACQTQLEHRILHSGASTTDILAVYVNLIHVFQRLDPRGVLLEVVSSTVRKYLRTRSDAANVIAQSLLADPDADVAASDQLCIAIATELQEAVHEQSQQSAMLDWDDMNWMPEPIDAGPNHRNAKIKDVLSHMLSLYDQDDFIKELESVLAEQLLKSKDSEILNETRLLEILKSRLDVVKLQNLEVMLKDMRDSITFEKRLSANEQSTAVPTPKEIQAAIPPEGIGITELYSRFEQRMRRTQFQAVLKLVAVKRSEMLFPKRGRLPPEPYVQQKHSDNAFQVRVLSSSAWPQMRTSTFKLPEPLHKHLQQAEERFSSLSGQRRLQWRPALGTISVNLELEDRTVSEADIPAWYGTVIYAFSDCDSLSAADLIEVLDMDEELVQDALAFWLRKRVLYRSSQGYYGVLERLDMDTMVTPPAQLAPFDTVSALKPQDALLREQAPTFEAFIGNMLRNTESKEVGGMMGITNMMKMVLPTFTYGDDEVQWLLGQMLGRGEVIKDGDVWKIA